MKKHKWKMTDYKTVPNEVDAFAAENLGSDYHNGPKCEVCGFEFCEWCFPEGYETKCGAKSLGSDDKKVLYKGLFE